MKARFSLAHDAYTQLGKIFNTPVVIGSTAVGLYGQRQGLQVTFRDLDMVVNEIPRKDLLLPSNFSNIVTVSDYQITMQFHSSSSPGQTLDIDIFHPDKRPNSIVSRPTMLCGFLASSEEVEVERMGKRNLVQAGFLGTPFYEIKEKANTISLDGIAFKVVDPIILAVMKYISYEYGNLEPEKKEREIKDVELLLKVTCGGSKVDFGYLLRAFVRRGRVYGGMSTNQGAKRFLGGMNFGNPELNEELNKFTSFGILMRI